ncbi:MAG TPA: AI-2E family transporter, partial [Nitrospirales bacterium]|nr:AI-2E family transporter [Nitrospirales bacterium]
AIVALVVLFMVAAFMLMDYDRISLWFRSRVPSNYRSDYDELCERLNAGLSGVIRGQLIICVVNGILSGIGFLIFIPEYALTFAVFAGVMSIIPIFGTIISTLPAVLIGMTVSWGTAMAILFWILGVHALEANILNPKIIAKQARLSPVLVIFALIAGEATFGIVGALLAVPTLSVLHSLMSFLFVRIRPEIIERS